MILSRYLFSSVTPINCFCLLCSFDLDGLRQICLYYLFQQIFIPADGGVHGGNFAGGTERRKCLIYFMCAWRKCLWGLMLKHFSNLLHVCMEGTFYTSVDIQAGAFMFYSPCSFMHVHGGNLARRAKSVIYFMCAWRKLYQAKAQISEFYLLHVHMEETLYAPVDILFCYQHWAIDIFLSV